MFATALWLVRLAIVLTAFSLAAVELSVAVVAAARAAEPSKNDNAPSSAERAVKRAAIEAVIWGMPVVNYDLMLQEMINKTNGKYNQIVYWSRLLDWRNRTLTPNPDSIYLMPFINTKDVGPW
jgi:hypothetical protein